MPGLPVLEPGDKLVSAALHVACVHAAAATLLVRSDGASARGARLATSTPAGEGGAGPGMRWQEPAWGWLCRHAPSGDREPRLLIKTQHS